MYVLVWIPKIFVLILSSKENFSQTILFLKKNYITSKFESKKKNYSDIKPNETVNKIYVVVVLFVKGSNTFLTRDKEKTFKLWEFWFIFSDVSDDDATYKCDLQICINKNVILPNFLGFFQLKTNKKCLLLYLCGVT